LSYFVISNLPSHGVAFSCASVSAIFCQVSAVNVRPACVRGKPWKGGRYVDRKPFEVIQRVRLPPGKGAARQPEASLARAAATSLVKRRQQVSKPWVSPDIMMTPKPSECWDRGQHRPSRYGRGRVGSTGILEQGKDAGWAAWDLRGPARVHVQSRRKWDAGRTIVPGSMAPLPREREGGHEDRRSTCAPEANT
jgi:hypothetical protein